MKVKSARALPVVAGLLILVSAVTGVVLFTSGEQGKLSGAASSAAAKSTGRADTSSTEETNGNPPASSSTEPAVAVAAEAVVEFSAPTVENRVDLSEPAPETHIWGWVHNENGAALTGAEVSWTAWDPRFMSFVFASAVIPPHEIQSNSVGVVTNENGWFQIEELPPLVANEPSYLWVTHSAHLAQLVEIAPGENGLTEEQKLILSPAPTQSARVLRDGLPVAGALVLQQAAFPKGIAPPLEAGPLAPKGMRIFFRQFQAGEDGVSLLAPAPHRHRLMAKHENQFSLPWQGEGESRVELELEDHCTLTGLVSFPVEYDDIWGLPQVRVLRHHGPFIEEIATVPVRSDGSMGPSLIPVLPAKSYALRLAGGGFIPSERVIETPSPGQKLHHEFAGEIGSTLWFLGKDEDQNILKGTSVRVTWQDNGRLVEKSAAERGDGYIRVTGLPPGIVSSEVSAPGLCPVSLRPITVPEDPAVLHPVILNPGYELSGLCMRGIDPASDFEVRYWGVTDQRNRSKVRVQDSKDGRFSIDGLGQPLVALEAISSDFERSDVKIIDLNDPSQSNVVLHLRPARAMTGTVIDSATGEPVNGALVDVYNSNVRYALDIIGPPVVTDSSGRFETRRLRSGTNIVSISAEGFSTRELGVVANDDMVDLGEIDLRSRQPLTARLLLPGGEDPTEYVLVAKGVGAVPITRFDSRGEIRIDSASEGSFLYQIRGRSVTGEILTWKRYTLTAGEEWHLEFQLVPGERQIRITTSGLGPDADPTQFTAGVTYPDPDGNEDFRSVVLDKAGEALVSGLIGPGPVSVRLSANDGSLGGGATLMIGDDAPDEVLLHVELDSKVVDVRVLDAKGKPLPGIEILPRSSKAGGMVLGWDITDSKGEAHFTTLAPQTDQVTLSSPSGGTIDRLPFEFPDRQGEWVELIFDMSSSIQLSIHEGGIAQSAANCRLISGEHGYRLTPGRTPDEDGQVTFSDLGAGSYELQVNTPGCWPVSRQVEATPAGSAYTVEVMRVGGLSLEVVGADGKAFAGQPVELRFVPLGQSVGAWALAGRLPGQQGPLTTDSAGRLRIDGIPRGQYQWTCGGASGSFVLVAGSVLEERLVVF